MKVIKTGFTIALLATAGFFILLSSAAFLVGTLGTLGFFIWLFGFIFLAITTAIYLYEKL